MNETKNQTHLKNAIADLKDAYDEVSRLEGILGKIAMNERDILFKKRDRKGLIALARMLPEQSEARHYTVQLIYRLDDLEISEGESK